MEEFMLGPCVVISMNSESYGVLLCWQQHQGSSVQSLSHVQLFATPWITAHQASLSITISWSSLKLMSIESVMPSSHLILCRPLLLLPPISPSIRVFSNESTLCMRWPKYWSFSFSIIPSKDAGKSHSHFTVQSKPSILFFQEPYWDYTCFQPWIQVLQGKKVSNADDFHSFLKKNFLICFEV